MSQDVPEEESRLDDTPPQSARKRRWPRRLLIAATLLYGLFAVGVGVVLPPLARDELVAQASAVVGRPVVLADLRLDPFAFAVTLGGLGIPAQQGDPLIAAEAIRIDVSLSSLWRRAVVLDEIRLTAPRVRVDIAADGSLELVDTFTSSPAEAAPEPTPADADAGLPPVLVRSLIIERGSVALSDASGAAPLRLDLEPLDLNLSDLDTRPDQQAAFQLSATTEQGERLSIEGSLGIEPLLVQAQLQVDDLGLASLWPYAGVPVPLDLTSGKLGVTGSLTVASRGDATDVRIDQGNLNLRDLKLATREPAGELLSLAQLDVSGIDVDVAQKNVHLAAVRSNGLTVNGAIDAQGRANYASLLASAPAAPVAADSDVADAAAAPAAPSEAPAEPTPVPSPAAPEAAPEDATTNPTAAPEPSAEAEPSPDGDTPPAAKEDAAWKIAVDEVQLDKYVVTFSDESVDPHLNLRLDPIALQLKGFRSDGGELDAHLTVAVEGGGSLDVTLAGPMAPMALAGKVQLDDLPLAISEPYVRQFARVTFASGRTAAQGDLAIVEADGANAVRYTGSLDVHELTLNRSADFGELLAWKRLGLVGIDLDTGKSRLAIAKIDLDEPRTGTSVKEDGTLDVGSVLVQRDEAAPPETAKPADDASPFAVEIAELQIRKGTLRFADRTVKPAFTTALEDLTGGAKNIHLPELGPVPIELAGTIEGEADFRVTGQVSPVGHAEPTDVKISLSGFDVTTLSPYSGRYAGYGVDKGRLTLNLAYRIEKNELVGKNALVTEQLALGEETKSPDAVSLPVKLALALLTDRKGRIMLDMPVRGKLDDPKFTISGTIFKTLGNLIEKTVTSPFSALGSLVGMGADELQAIDFAPGSAELSDDERAKIDALGKALKDRPALRLEIRGVGDTTSDAPRLARAQLENEIRVAWLKEKKLPEDDTTSALPDADRERLLQVRYEEELGAEATGSVDEVADALAQRLSVDPEAVRLLARRRSAIIRDELVTRGVPIEQLFRAKSVVRDKGTKVVATELTISGT